MPPNAADRKSIRRLEKAAKLADEQKIKVLNSLQEIFWRFCKFGAWTQTWQISPFLYEQTLLLNLT